MALTDEQKLEIIQAKFCQKIYAQETLDELKTLIQNITPASVKNFVQTALTNEASKITSQASDLTATSSDVNSLETEVDGW